VSDTQATPRGCTATEAACICTHPPDHDGPHECDCGGKWTYAADGALEPVLYPGGVAPSVLLPTIIAILTVPLYES
jgi:hypothetical protein